MLAICMSTLLLSLVLSQRREAPGLWVLGLFVAALAVLFAYVRRARRVPEPIIRPALFADPAFAVPNVMNVLASLAGFSILLLTPYYLVNVLKLSALVSGAGAGAGLRRQPDRRAVVGLAGRAASASGRPRSPASPWSGSACCRSPSPAPTTPVARRGAAADRSKASGQGLLAVAYTDIVTATLAVRDRGVAGSLALLTRTLGTVSGASVLTALHAAGAAGLSGHRRLPRRLSLTPSSRQAAACCWRCCFRSPCRAPGSARGSTPCSRSDW